MGNLSTELKKQRKANGRAKEIVKTRLWKYINHLDLLPLDAHEIIRPFELAKQGHVLYWRSYFKLRILHLSVNSPLKLSETL